MSLDLVNSLDLSELNLTERNVVRQINIRFKFTIAGMNNNAPDTSFFLRFNNSTTESYKSFAKLEHQDNAIIEEKTGLSLGRTAYKKNSQVTGTYTVIVAPGYWRIGQGLVTYASKIETNNYAVFGWECHGYYLDDDSPLNRVALFKQGQGTVASENAKIWYEVYTPPQAIPALNGVANNSSSENDLAELAASHNDLAVRFNSLIQLLYSKRLIDWTA